MASEDRLVAKELRERNDDELRSLLGVKQEELHKTTFKKALGQLKQTHLLRQLKREIAVIQTVQRERATEGAK